MKKWNMRTCGYGKRQKSHALSNLKHLFMLKRTKYFTGMHDCVEATILTNELNEFLQHTNTPNKTQFVIQGLILLPALSIGTQWLNLFCVA